MSQFLRDLKQSAPWWLMLLLQVIDAVLRYLAGAQ